MKQTAALILSNLVLFLAVSSAVAQRDGLYEVSWFTADGGGGQSQEGDYAISGTIGQPEAGPVMIGGQFTLQGGFWLPTNTITAPPAKRSKVYLPLVLRQG